ncbi:hypothetical protein ACFL4C_00995 [Candidatus Omnitrophota bacterium]
MKENKKTIIPDIFLIIYIIFYLYSWKLFLEMEYFSFLIPYAIIWIFSAFICLFLSKTKRQIPFYSFFAGSIFGPIGVFMTLLSMPDFRSAKPEDRDEDFYKSFCNEIQKLRKKILFYSKISSFIYPIRQISDRSIYMTLRILDDSVKAKTNFPFEIGDVYGCVDHRVFLALLTDIEFAFRCECEEKLGIEKARRIMSPK